MLSVLVLWLSFVWYFVGWFIKKILQILISMEAPSQALAKRIVARLLKEGLISEKEAKNLPAKIADGRQRPEDWRLSIELNDTKEVKR